MQHNAHVIEWAIHLIALKQRARAMALMRRMAAANTLALRNMPIFEQAASHDFY